MNRSGRVRSFDGTPIAFRVTGEGEPTVFLSNGIGCHRVFLRYLVRDLSARYRVVCWDYRGHGDSDRPVDPDMVTMDACIQDMLAVLEATDTDEAVFGGFSMGVQLSLEFYARYPERVRALLALCGAYEHPVRTLKNVGALVDTAMPAIRWLATDHPGLTRAVWRTLLTGPWAFRLGGLMALYDTATVRRDDFTTFRGHFADLDMELFAKMATYMNQHTAVSVLPRVQVPTLVVAGERDPLTPLPVTRRLHARIPGAEWCLVRGGTHTTLLEHPEKVNPRVAEFLDQHFPRKAVRAEGSAKRAPR